MNLDPRQITKLRECVREARQAAYAASADANVLHAITKLCEAIEWLISEPVTFELPRGGE